MISGYLEINAAFVLFVKHFFNIEELLNQCHIMLF